jgi:hypothetical protein
MGEQLQILNDSERKSLEEQHAAERNRRELINERRHGLGIIIYWLGKTNTISMVLLIDNYSREFDVPNDEVLQARDHPEIYATRAGKVRESFVAEDNDGA